MSQTISYIQSTPSDTLVSLVQKATLITTAAAEAVVVVGGSSEAERTVVRMEVRTLLAPTKSGKRHVHPFRVKWLILWLT